MSSTAPGWHPDPYRRHASRYWDGGRWTEHVSDGGAPSVDDPTAPTPPQAPPTPQYEAPPAAPPAWSAPPPAWSPLGAGAPAPPASPAERVPAIVALAGAVLLLVAAFLPWFEVELTFAGSTFSETVSGTDADDGIIAILLALVAGGLAIPRILGKGPYLLGIGLVVVGLLATLLGVIDLGNDDLDSDVPLAGLADISPSVGLFLVIAAGLVIAVAGAAMVVAGRSRATA
jgi:Protein of unknown function (DUF2510)